MSRAEANAKNRAKLRAKISGHCHKNKIGTSTPPLQKRPRTPLKGGILWAWGFSSKRNQKIPGAHKIGVAISGPRIAGGKITDMRIFLGIVMLNFSQDSSQFDTPCLGRESSNRAPPPFELSPGL